jgi:hypothetical protein
LPPRPVARPAAGVNADLQTSGLEAKHSRTQLCTSQFCNAASWNNSKIPFGGS